MVLKHFISFHKTYYMDICEATKQDLCPIEKKTAKPLLS